MNANIRTAFHEAGHAVLAHITGVYEIDGAISISGPVVAEIPLRRDALRCSARAMDYAGLTNDDYDYEQAIIAAAGIEAERKYLENNGLPVDEELLFRGAHGDIQLVLSLLGAGRWREVCETASRYLGDDSLWKVVERLSSAILRTQPHLSANHATEILEQTCIEFDVQSIRVLK